MNPAYDMLEKTGLRNGSNDRIPAKKFDFAQDPFFNEGELIHVPAARPNVCIIYAPQVGEEGTIRLIGQTYSDEQVIKASDKVIVIAEEAIMM